MIVFATILVMLAAAVVLLALARSLRLPYPALLALAGAGVAVAPVDIGLRLDPELALALFIAPVLLDAAYDTSLRDLKRHWIPVASLALVAVGLTTAAVALVVHAMVPGIPWAAAIAIGAIVAPPDAVAATTLLRELRLPRRVSVILEGEALLNDASALLIYRLAVTAVLAGGSIGADAIAPTFLLSLFGSVTAGLGLAWMIGHVTRRIEDVPSSIIIQFVSTYGVWLLADRAGLSPILTMVSYAMTLARFAPAYLPARLRIPSYAVWETAVLVLNVLAFLIIGLELGPIIAGARGPLDLAGRGRAGHGHRRAAAVDACRGSVGSMALESRRFPTRRRPAAELANGARHRLGRHARSRYRCDGLGAAPELSGARDAVVRCVYGDAGHPADPGNDAETTGARP